MANLIPLIYPAQVDSLTRLLAFILVLLLAFALGFFTAAIFLGRIDH